MIKISLGICPIVENKANSAECIKNGILCLVIRGRCITFSSSFTTKGALISIE